VHREPNQTRSGCGRTWKDASIQRRVRDRPHARVHDPAAGEAIDHGALVADLDREGQRGRLYARLQRHLRDAGRAADLEAAAASDPGHLVLVILLAVMALGIVLTGPIVNAVAGPIGFGSTATTNWDFAKWPVLMGLFVVMLGIIYYASPNVKMRGFKWVTPGSLVEMVVWSVASAAFAFYVANFGSYNKTYATLAGLVVLLMWMWITNLAILFGHQLNAERERSAEIAEGVPRAEKEIQLEPRDAPKEQKTT
jgi:hypothetical protein